MFSSRTQRNQAIGMMPRNNPWPKKGWKSSKILKITVELKMGTRQGHSNHSTRKTSQNFTCRSGNQFVANYAVTGDWHGALQGVIHSCFWINTQKVKGSGKQILGGYRCVLHFASMLVGTANYPAPAISPPAKTTE
jgi:hypothetical protein